MTWDVKSVNETGPSETHSAEPGVSDIVQLTGSAIPASMNETSTFQEAVTACGGVGLWSVPRRLNMTVGVADSARWRWPRVSCQIEF